MRSAGCFNRLKGRNMGRFGRVKIDRDDYFWSGFCGTDAEADVLVVVAAVQAIWFVEVQKVSNCPEFRGT